MEIPENWQEELLLHDWKMMRIDRCRISNSSEAYDFPNGLSYHFTTIKVDFEKANAVVAALSDLEPKKKVKKGEATIKLNWDRYKVLNKGEREDLLWRIYSLDI